MNVKNNHKWKRFTYSVSYLIKKSQSPKSEPTALNIAPGFLRRFLVSPVARRRGGEVGQLPHTFFWGGGNDYLFPPHTHTFRGSFRNHANAERQYQYDKLKVIVCCSPRIFESIFLSKLEVFMEVLPKIN